jgi:triacylglycerol lipase
MLNTKILESSIPLRPNRSAARQSAASKRSIVAGYCDRRALHLADLAHWSYDDAATIAEQCEKFGYSEFHFFDQGATQAVLVGNEQDLVLTFRGTELTSLQDWITNSECSQTKASGGRVHAGFWQDWQMVWAQVETQLQESRQKSQRFWLTGHSLGGALAMVAAVQLQLMGHKIDGIYSFGAPRLGDRDFALHFNRRLYAQTFRLVNHKDIVPHLPPLDLGYVHVGQLIYFNESGDRVPYPGQDEDDFALTQSFTDHDILAYKDCVRSNPA